MKNKFRDSKTDLLRQYFRTDSTRGKLIVVAALAMSVLAACTDEVATSAEEGSATSALAANSENSLPAMYLDRDIENLHNGINKARESYQTLIDACNSVGKPTASLAPEEVDRLGKKRWQFWRMPGLMAYKVESWSAKMGDIRQGKECEFTFETEGVHVYYDTEKTLSLDLKTGERKQTHPEPHRLQVLDASPDESDWAAWSGWGSPTDETVVGQPCKQWRSPRGDTSCLWSGGTQWGFSYITQGIFGSNAGFELGAITLQAEPGTGTVGDRLTTTQFVIGADFDPQDMMP